MIEVKADQFGKTIENARDDFILPKRSALVIKTFLEETKHLTKMREIPDVEAKVTQSTDGKKNHITWNVNFDQISALLGKELNFQKATPPY